MIVVPSTARPAVPVEEPTYTEHVRVPDLSVGVYTLPPGAADPQQPHTEDEVYVVVRGRGRLWTPDRTVDATAGDTLFVPAGEPHRFVDITEELTVVVVFGPAEHTRRHGSALSSPAD